jgi:uncharacterized protein (TIGR02391 family)
MPAITKEFLQELRKEIADIKKCMYEAAGTRFRQGESEQKAAWEAEIAPRYNDLWLSIEVRLNILRDANIGAENPNSCRTLADWEQDRYTHRCNGKTVAYWVTELYRPITDAIDLTLTRESLGLESWDELLGILRKKFQDPAPLALDTLHRLIRERCTEPFLAKSFDHAIMDAMKVVEDEVRSRSRAQPTSVGVQLMTETMKGPKPIFKLSDVEAEQDSAYFLFRGAIGFFKNPHSHRFISTNDAGHTFEILMFASLLLRLLDSADKNPQR